MSPRRRDAEQARAAILEGARRLFAARDVAAVSIRDIAQAAGVSHGLVQHHFGTRERLVAAIVQNEIDELAARPRALPGGASDLERLRVELKAGVTRFRDHALIITRAELAGAEPERLLDPAVPTPAMLLAASIRDLQAGAVPSPGGLDPDLSDPDLVSAYVTAGLFAFAKMAPWLMTAVGLEPQDYETRLDEIIDISVRLIALSVGAPSGS